MVREQSTTIKQHVNQLQLGAGALEVRQIYTGAEIETVMSAHTILLDLSVDPVLITNSVERETLQQDVKSILQEYLSSLNSLQSLDVNGGFLTLLSGAEGSIITIRGFTQGLLTVNIEYFISDSEQPLLDYQQTRKLETALKRKLSCKRSKSLPPIKRGCVIDPYNITSDERLLEYSIDKVLFEAESPFQKVQIVHTSDFGNLLILDGLQNMAESDLIYTETLMQKGKENYNGKEVLILGGGDGGLLWELLKEKPKFVTMIEIDDVVIKAVREHMRSVCGNCFDNYNGSNYEIIIDDAFKIMQQYTQEKRTYDYVFGDLTEVPLSPSSVKGLWDLLCNILCLSIQLLKPRGKFMTQVNGICSETALLQYDEELKKLKTPVNFSKCSSFIPSFVETWVFYQVWKKN